MEKLLTAYEISEVLRIKPSTVYSLASKDQLPFIQIGGRKLFKMTDIERFLSENTVYPTRTVSA